MAAFEESLRTIWLEVLQSQAQGNLLNKMICLPCNTAGNKKAYSGVRIVACLVCALSGSLELLPHQSLLEDLMTVCPEDLAIEM